MNPRIINVEPLAEYKLKLFFSSGEIKIMNITPYLEIGDFNELKDVPLFNSVKPFLGSIQWSNGLDLCPDCLYLESVPV
ncbi:MAG: DUF2442 domain-containing protein [Ignavibacteriales bacterium]|nr:DUF2442 domain-containing protein [Ignavibacteriales bacterium]